MNAGDLKPDCRLPCAPRRRGAFSGVAWRPRRCPCLLGSGLVETARSRRRRLASRRGDAHLVSGGIGHSSPVFGRRGGTPEFSSVLSENRPEARRVARHSRGPSRVAPESVTSRTSPQTAGPTLGNPTQSLPRENRSRSSSFRTPPCSAVPTRLSRRLSGRKRAEAGQLRAVHSRVVETGDGLRLESTPLDQAMVIRKIRLARTGRDPSPPRYHRRLRPQGETSSSMWTFQRSRESLPTHA